MRSRRRRLPALPPFAGCRVYGPYESHGGRRRVVHVIWPNGRRTGMDFGRFRMCVKEGRILERHEEVDHVDEDPTNNDESNLRITTHRENVRKSVKLRGRSAKVVRLRCALRSCGRAFERKASDVKEGPSFCSRSCSGRSDQRAPGRRRRKR